MQRKLMAVFIVFVIVVVLGYFGYREVYHFVALKVVDKISRSLTPQEVAKFTNDPKFIQEAQSQSLNLDPSHLTLQDKEQVVSIVTKDFTVFDLKQIGVEVVKGNLTADEKQQLISQYKSKLTQQDIRDLKTIASDMIQK